MYTQVIAENRTDIVIAPVHSTSPLLLNDDEDGVISSGQNYESKLRPLSQTHTDAVRASTSSVDEGSDSDNDNDDTDDASGEVSSDGDSDSEPDQDSYDNKHQSTSATTNNTSASNVDTHTSMATNSNHKHSHTIPHRDYPMVLCGDFNTLLETECFDSDTGYTPSSLIELMRTGQVCI